MVHRSDGRHVCHRKVQNRAALRKYSVALSLLPNAFARVSCRAQLGRDICGLLLRVDEDSHELVVLEQVALALRELAKELLVELRQRTCVGTHIR